MAFTDAQAKKRALQIFEQVGSLIRGACKGSGVSESFVAGFIGVESAFSSTKVLLNSKRFEKGVYDDLISLRDNGYCYIGGKKRTTYSGVKQSQIKDASNPAIRNLATSWGITQIMGWHIINNLKCTLEDLRDPEKHLHYTIKLLKIVGGSFLSNGDLPSVLHIWNTGSAKGKTYHEDYVENALKVKRFYDDLLRANPNVSSSITTDRQPSRSNQPETISSRTDDRLKPSIDQSVANGGGDEGNTEISNNLADNTDSPQNSNAATETTQTATVQTENATVASETTIKNEQDVNKPAEVGEPKPQGFKAKLTAGIVTLLGGTVLYDSLGKFAGIQFSAQSIYIICFILFLGFLGFCVWAILDTWKKNKKTELEVLANTAIDRKNIVWIKPEKEGFLQRLF